MGTYNASITLDFERAVYYPGQVVSGVVELQLSAPLTFSVLYATYLGEATVEWFETETEKYNGEKRHKQIKYAGKEEYFKYTQLLAGGAETTHLQVGSYKYPISFQLPPKVPSSFRGERGDVTYSIRVQMLFQGREMFEQEVVKNFEVVAPLDLNKGSDVIKEPIELEFDEVYSCCFGSGPLSVRIGLPVAGYCPGQCIPATVDIRNRTNYEVLDMNFQLIWRECYRSQRPPSEYVSEGRVLSTARRGAVLARQHRHFTVELPVPHILVPYLEHCAIIDVGYFFKVTLKISGCHEDLEDESEICLGLVPLEHTIEGSFVHPMADRLPQGPIPELPEVPPSQNINVQNQAPNMNIPYPIQAQNIQYPYPAQNLPYVAYPNQAQMLPQYQHQAQAYPNPQGGYQTTCYVEYKREVISTDPSQNSSFGFKVTYPSNVQSNMIEPSAPPPP